MRILAQKDQGSSGDVQLAPGIRIGHLEQEPLLDDGATVLENIEPALAHMRQMLDVRPVAVARAAHPVRLPTCSRACASAAAW